jgi:hypothetical protein
MAVELASAENRVRFRGWVTAEEAAELLGVGRDYIYRLKSVYDEGGSGVPGFRLGDSGRILMFRTADLEAYRKTHPNLGKLRASESPEPEEEEEEEEEESAEDDETPEPEPAQA